MNTANDVLQLFAEEYGDWRCAFALERLDDDCSENGVIYPEISVDVLEELRSVYRDPPGFYYPSMKGPHKIFRAERIEQLVASMFRLDEDDV